MGVALLELRGPGGELVYVNPDAVMLVRLPRPNEYHEKVKTVIEFTQGAMGVEEVIEEVVEILRARGAAWA